MHFRCRLIFFFKFTYVGIILEYPCTQLIHLTLVEAKNFDRIVMKIYNKKFTKFLFRHDEKIEIDRNIFKV